MKFCKDCIFYTSWHPKYPSYCSKFTRKDPVEGYTSNIYTCTDARAEDDLCGPSAVYFKVRDTVHEVL